MSEKKYDRLEIDGAVYKTHFTEKFANRKKWEPTSPGVVTTRIPGSIIEVHVQEGQEVKKGDPLLSYDMTLVNIDLEMEKLTRQPILPLSSDTLRTLTSI